MIGDVVSRYNLLSGGGALPPLWGLGFWHRVHATADADRVRREVAEFEARRIPLDVVGLEPGWMTRSYPCTFEWQKKRFPDPAAFAADLLARGIRLNLWENPYVSPESRLYKTMFPLSASHMVWLGLVPDYTLPDARRALVEQHAQDHLAIGVSGYKIDEVDGFDVWLWPDHASFPSGTPAPAMRQAYGLLMQDLIFKDLFKARNQRTYGLVRASNGAASGYPFAIYSDAYDLKEYITGMSASGFAGVLWTPEIRSARDERDWINRMQVVAFSALAQLNAWASGATPWHFEGASGMVRETLELRMRLLPYLYSAFAAYHFDGVPPIRPMAFEDPSLAGVDDQFMFGPSVLVAPFYGKAGWTREVVLPAGRWYDFYTGRVRRERRSRVAPVRHRAHPAARARGRRHPDAEGACDQYRARVRAGARGPPLRQRAGHLRPVRRRWEDVRLRARTLPHPAVERGSRRRRAPDARGNRGEGAAAPMFGPSELRAMTR